jgi:UDP-N-acetylmuramoylalanine--D-glutamate ligase
MTFSVEGKRVTVVGAARSGLAAAELLAHRGASVTLTDTRSDVPDAEALRRLGVALELGGHRREAFADADLIVLSPGVPPEQPMIQAARDRGIPVIAEIELASRWLQGRVIAITGTKGKSTTTALTGRILERAGLKVTVGGNIGAPLSAQVSDSTPDTFHVVETSSFQLEQIETFHPWIAVMLNFSPDHLDRHPTVEAYAAAKARIFENQRGDDWAVINADDPAVLALAQQARARKRYFALHGHRARSGLDRRSHVARRASARAGRRDSLARTASRQRRDGGSNRRPARGRHVGGHDGRSGLVPRPRARDGTRRRRQRCAVRQRLEGDQHRVGAAIDRELRSRSRADHGRQVQGR